MARILSGADFGVRFPQGGGEPNNDFMTSLSSQLIGLGLKQQHETDLIQQQQALEAQKAEQLAQATGEKNRLTGMFTQLERVKNLTPVQQRKELALLGQSEFKAGRDGSEFIEALNANTPDELNLAISRLSTKAGNLAGQFDEVLKANAPPAEEKGFTLSKGQVRFDKNGIKIAELKEGEGDGPDWQQGTGPMSGFAFNPSTGEFKLSGIAQKALEQEAKKESDKKGQLGPKDIAGVNDKVTALTKGVIDIADAGKALDALEVRSTPAAKLAAVFKFMKAMDPSSTVRESEQGQVYAAEGLMKGFANQINAALGEGGLSESGFRDLTNTAKALANSAIESSQETVAGYLDVLSDKITVRDHKALLARVPQKLELSGDIERKQTPPANPEKIEDLKNLTLEQLNELKAQKEAGL